MYRVEGWNYFLSYHSLNFLLFHGVYLGRSICGGWAADILGNTLPEMVRRSLYFESLDAKMLQAHVLSSEDQVSAIEYVYHKNGGADSPGRRCRGGGFQHACHEFGLACSGVIQIFLVLSA